jgi:hypothetical protein
VKGHGDPWLFARIKNILEEGQGSARPFGRASSGGTADALIHKFWGSFRG